MEEKGIVNAFKNLSPDKAIDVSNITDDGTRYKTVKRATNPRTRLYLSDLPEIVSGNVQGYNLAIDLLSEELPEDPQVYKTEFATAYKNMKKGETTGTVTAEPRRRAAVQAIGISRRGAISPARTIVKVSGARSGKKSGAKAKAKSTSGAKGKAVSGAKAKPANGRKSAAKGKAVSGAKAKPANGRKSAAKGKAVSGAKGKATSGVRGRPPSGAKGKASGAKGKASGVKGKAVSGAKEKQVVLKEKQVVLKEKQ